MHEDHGCCRCAAQIVLGDFLDNQFHFAGSDIEDLEQLRVHIILILRNIQRDILARGDVGRDGTLVEPVLDRVGRCDFHLGVGTDDVDIDLILIIAVALLQGVQGKGDLVVDFLLLDGSGVRRGVALVVGIPGQDQLEVRLVVVAGFHLGRVGVVHRVSLQLGQVVIRILEDIARSVGIR